jgi:hypothetical protein
MVGFTSLIDVMERRAIDYRSAEQAYALLVQGGFECGDPYFPAGNGEPTGYSTATCERGFTTVHINVNQERGSWLKLGPDEYSEPWTSGAAFVRGRNWSVGFEAPPNREGSLAREVQAILGGELRHPLPQEDY